MREQESGFAAFFHAVCSQVAEQFLIIRQKPLQLFNKCSGFWLLLYEISFTPCYHNPVLCQMQ